MGSERMAEVITNTNLQLKQISKGKVRDTYELPDGNLLMIATDRLSAFDVVFGQGIPYKGQVLNMLSAFWFQKLSSVVPHHMISTEIPSGLPVWLNNRAMVVKKCTPVKMECVVRGYLVGSGWKEYCEKKSVCGIKLPDGLRQASKLSRPLFTPSTKADVGHDMNVTPSEGRKLVGPIYDEIERVSIKLYNEAAAHAERCGIILADTKFEFGLDASGKLIWIDEALTPDSSRYWPKESYKEGISPPSYDKQFVRDYLEGIKWDKKPPAPTLPDVVIKGTTDKYVEAYEKLSGKRFVMR